MSKIILTMRQQQIYQWMRDYWEEKGYAPTQEEVAEAHQISQNTARQHIKALDKKGYISSTAGLSRCIKFLD